MQRKPAAGSIIINYYSFFAFIKEKFDVWYTDDPIFIHPDAQGGLAFIVIPLWQWALLVLVTIPVYFCIEH